MHDTAFLAIHYQREVILPNGAIRQGFAVDDPQREAFIRCVADSLALFRRRRIPVISVRIAFAPDYSDLIANCPIFESVRRAGAMREGTEGVEFVPGLGPIEGETVISHRRTSAFVGTDLEQRLIMMGARRLLIGGVATHSAVEATARHASDLGYDVTVVADLCHSADQAFHDASLRALALVATITESSALSGPDQQVNL
jgi:nicotinamidase-related amidase